jgi:hypothetical protein
MSRYGIDYYGLSYYGADVINTYSAAPVTAISSNYGEITLAWVDPVGNWSNLKLVRNSYGFPVNAYDGVQLLNVFNGSDPTTFIDTFDLVPERYYYYSIFVYETNQFKWVRAGDVIGLSVENYNNQQRLYEYLPDAYKLSTIYTIDNSLVNTELQGFLNIFGFQLDYIQTVTHLLVNRYNTERVNGNLIPLLLKQFGFEYEQNIGYQQSRILVRDALQLYQEKGSAQGLREYIKAFSGWALPKPIAGTPNPTINGITINHNLMLDYNDSSFEESIGHWESTSNASMHQLKVKGITSVSLTDNVAKITIGTHNYAVGTQITISECLLPLFNQVTPVTISDVTSTSIKFNLTSADVPETKTTGIVYPNPLPWTEITAPVNFPNKQNGILALTNSNASSGTVSIACGASNPVTKGVPVTNGLAYTFSVYSAALSTTRTVTAKINWYNRFGNLISTSSGTGLANTTGGLSIRPKVTATAPSNAYYAVPEISIASVAGSTSLEFHFFDAAQLEQASAVTSFDEARQIYIKPRASRINELIDPHFASPIAPWSVTNASYTIDVLSQEPGVDIYTITNKELTSNVAIITTATKHPFQINEVVVVSGVGTPFDGAYTITARTQNTFTYAKTNINVLPTATTGTVYHAGNALQVTATGTAVAVKSYTTSADYMPIYYPDSSYTFSVYGKTITGTKEITAYISWYDVSKTLISTTVGAAVTVTSNWTRGYVTGTAPSTAAYAHVQINWSAAVGDIIELDSALFEKSPFVLPYFDGENGNEPGDLFWEGGVANAGRSHLYKNRIAVENRLTKNLKEFLPMGTTYALYLAQPQT